MGQELGVGCWLLGGPRSHLLFSDEGTRVQAGVTLSQGDPLGLWRSNPRWNLVKGLEEAGEEVTGSPRWLENPRVVGLDLPFQSARPAPGPHASTPTCPEERGWGVRSQQTEKVLGPVMG